MKKFDYVRRLQDWLTEADGEQFQKGKWRFWLPALLLFGILNVVLTAVIFGSSGNLQAYIGVMMLSAGAAVGWLGVGALHYSDSPDGRMACGVSLLDSATLVFVVLHFCFLLWVQGHLWNLQAADMKYEVALAEYNAKAGKISSNNVEIAKAIVEAERERTKAEKLRNDTAYQQWKTVEAGGRLNGRRARLASSSGSTSLSMSPVVLKEPEKPKDNAVDYLSRWDALIRFANFGEIGLAIVTMIYIRTRSAKYNASRASSRRSPARVPELEPGEFPDEIEAREIEKHSDRLRLSLRQGAWQIATAPEPVATDPEPVATAPESLLNALRDHLRVIAFDYPGKWFKCDPGPNGSVLIRLCHRLKGREETIGQTKQAARIFTFMDRPDFREKLRAGLIKRNFPL